MIRYTIRRILIMIPVLLGVIFITFTLSHFMPGDPVVNMLPTTYTEEQYEAKKAELGLDRPFIVQLGDYLWGVVTRFDLGTSYSTKRDVTNAIGDRVLTTVKIGLMSVCVTVLVGIPVGIISATHQYSRLDYAVTAFAVFFTSMPSFWLALMAIIIFSLRLGWLPASGLTSWKHYILPVLCNGLVPIAATLRMTRSSMLEVIRQDYITTARAKGLKEKTIITRHALKNALIPVITVVGFQISQIIGGSVIIESIFSIAGIGTLLVTAINNRDYPSIVGITIIISIFVCIMNLIVDLVYSAADPRIKAQFFIPPSKKKKAEKGGK